MLTNEALSISYGDSKIEKELTKAIKRAEIAMMSDEDAENLADAIYAVLSHSSQKKRGNETQKSRKEKDNDAEVENGKEKQSEQPKFNDDLDKEFSKINVDIQGRKGQIPNKVVNAIVDKYNDIKTTEEINADNNAKGRQILNHDVAPLWKELVDMMFVYNLSTRQTKALIRNYRNSGPLEESLVLNFEDAQIAKLISDAIRYAMKKGYISDFMRLSDNEISRLTKSVGETLGRLSNESGDEEDDDMPRLVSKNDNPSENKKSGQESSKSMRDWGEETINAINKARAERMSANESLNEAAGLSKISSYLNEYDCACISAQKYLPNRRDFQTQHEYETEFKSRLGKQKKTDSKTLQVELRSNFGGVINIQGFYRYGTSEKADKEKSYFVVNRNMSESAFKSKLMELACDAKQNSFFFSPKGTRSGYWIYTGIDLSEPDEIDKYHDKGDTEYVGVIYLGKIKQDDESTSYSMVNDRPFAALKKENAVVIDEAFEEPYGSVIYRNEGEYANMVKRVVDEEKKKKEKKCCDTVSDDVGDISVGINAFNAGNSCCVSEELSASDAIFHLNRLEKSQ